MSILKTQVIPIEYDQSTEKLAFYLKEYLEDNKEFFSFFLNGNKISLTDKKCEMFIKAPEDLLEHLKDISIDNAQEFLNSSPIKEADQKFVLLYLWKERLLKDKYDFPFDREMLHTLSVWTYVKKTKDFASYYKYTHGERKDVENKIFYWYQKTYRVDLLNLLLDIQIQRLQQEDNDTNILSMITWLNSIIDEESKKEEITNLEELTQYISKERSFSLISEFLIKIDPTLTWYQEFLTLQKDNKIIEDKNDKRLRNKKDLNWQTFNTNGNWYIYTPWEYTLADSVNFIHEFVHYICLKNEEPSRKTTSILGELPSIFFEYAMCDFLKEKNYSEEEIKKRINMRLSETSKYCMDVESIVERIEKRLKGEEVTLEKEIEEVQDLERNMQRKNPGFSFEKECHKSIDEIASSYIDMDIVTLLTKPNILYTTCPYIVGNKYTLDLRERGESVTSTMLSICPRACGMTTEEILQELSLKSKPENNAKRKELK